VLPGRAVVNVNCFLRGSKLALDLATMRSLLVFLHDPLTIFHLVKSRDRVDLVAALDHVAG
jgi:hypothetical protein